MKKSFFGTITVMLLLAMVLPLSVNAATLTVDKSEMNVGEVVTVEVNTKQDVESIQFDLQFDSSKYEYVNDSAVSDLDSTDSNLIANDMVRVSAFDMNASKADTVTMKFKAIAGGTSVPFRIVGTVEIGENGEQFDATEVQIKQINGKNTEIANNPQYVDGNGKVITRLPQTGGKKTIGMYGDLVVGENVVTYALPYSDDTLSAEDIKAQFGSEVTVVDADNNGILGTGETIEINGTTYTIIIYGDVNGDGRVTTADALKTRKNDVGTETVNSVKQEALDVVKDANKDSDDKANALAQQAFILRKQYGTEEQTIIDAYPAQSGSLIENISGTKQTTNGNRYEDITVAEVSSTGNDAITQNILTYEIKLDGTIVNKDSKTAEVSYTEKSTGKFAMSLYVAKAGNYEVTPIITGTNVKNGVQRGETYTVEVAESNEITAIKVKEGTTEVIGNAQVRLGKEKRLNVEFVHEYTDTKFGTTPEPFVVEGIDNSKVNVTFADNSYFASETGLADNVLTVKPVKTGNTTITLEMDGKSKVISVNILPEAGIKQIILNGTEFSDTVTSLAPINVYRDKKYVSSDKTDKFVKPIGNQNATVNELVFTVLPISLKDEDGDIFNTVKIKDIVSIYETADDSNPDFQFSYYALNNNNEYEERTNENDRIDAIGIAFEQELDLEYLEDINTGVTIEYTTVNGTKKATIPVKVFENGIEVTKAADEAQPDDSVSDPGTTTPVTKPDVDGGVNNNPADKGETNVGGENNDNTSTVKPGETTPDNKDEGMDEEKPSTPSEDKEDTDNGENTVQPGENPGESPMPQPTPGSETEEN